MKTNRLGKKETGADLSEIPEKIKKADAPPPLSARPQKFALLKERFLSHTSLKG